MPLTCSRWLIERAAAMGRPGPYQVQGAIAACHAEALTWDATDWPQILILYDLLLQLAPSPVVRLNRAVALRQIGGEANGLAVVPGAEGIRQLRGFSGYGTKLEGSFAAQKNVSVARIHAPKSWTDCDGPLDVVL